MMQLTEIDNAMLQMDSPRTPQVISMVGLYDASSSTTGDVEFSEIREVFARTLKKSAIFRRRISDKSRGWDTPFWVEDSGFDLDFHLRHVALPQPGNWRQLCNQVARLHANQIDMSRPLWEAYVIEGLSAIDGLPRGSFAIMLKCHHAAVDGVGAARLVDLLNSRHPGGEPEDDQTDPDNWKGESEPSLRQVWMAGYANSRRRQKKLIETVRQVAPKIMRSSNGKDEKQVDKNDKAGADSQRTLFNASVSSRRVVGGYTVTLDQLKAVRQAVGGGVTLNDVAVTVVSGAMRKYLTSHGHAPQSGLIAAVPTSVRESLEGDILGNEIGSIMIGMGADISDPVERLRAVHQSAVEAKHRTEELGKRTQLDFSRSLSPQVLGLGVKIMSMMGSATNTGVMMHTNVSNVPGPLEPRYMAGAILHSIVALGPLTDGTGLTHCLMSGAGRVPICFVACRDIVADPEFYEECIASSWKELEDAARSLPGPEVAPKSRGKSSAAGMKHGKE